MKWLLSWLKNSAADDGDAIARPTEEMRKARTGVVIYCSLVWLLLFADPGDNIKFPGADVQMATDKALTALLVVASFYLGSFAVETNRTIKSEPDGASRLAVAEFEKTIAVARDRVESSTNYSAGASAEIRSRAQNLVTADEHERQRAFATIVDGGESERSAVYSEYIEDPAERYDKLRKHFDAMAAITAKAVDDYLRKSELKKELLQLASLVSELSEKTPAIESELAKLPDALIEAAKRVESSKARFRRHELRTFQVWDVAVPFIAYGPTAVAVFIVVVSSGG